MTKTCTNQTTFSDASVSSLTVGSLSAEDGNNILLKAGLLPDQDVVYDIGNASTRFNRFFGAEAWISSLHPIISSFIAVYSNLLPSAGAPKTLGDVSNQWGSVYNLNNFLPKGNSGTLFTMPGSITITAGVAQLIDLSINESNYTGTGQTFKFPQNGFYVLNFQVNFDVGFLNNQLIIDLFLFNALSVQSTHVLNSSAYSKRSVTFGIWIDNFSTDRFGIRVATSTDTITNFTVPFGRMICGSTYSYV